MNSISGYKITQELYTSGRTIIYQGYYEKDKTPVILKTFKTDYSITKGNLRLKNEYCILKNLDAKGILKAYKLVKYGERFVLVLEGFTGECLKEFINSNRVQLEVFLRIALQLSNILGDIHKSGVIHKNIRSNNIMIDKKTGQVKIIDFSISTCTSFENDIIVDTDILDGTLAYIAPEQTGRMNCGIDYRVDYYSLGVILYEMITGRLPFVSDEPMEMIHNHIAKIPLSPCNINKKIPRVVSDIILKLLSKNPEERYQSAYGIKADLIKCISQLEQNGRVEYFPIGKEDILDKFKISEKLYNRDDEIKRLMNKFEEAVGGKKEIVFISGPSGVGKTSLIRKIQKHISSKNGYFVSGKFEQLNRNIPYFPFVQAFRQLISHILTESDDKIVIWKEKLLQVFGDNGQIIIDIIPEIELIIGKQQSIQELSAEETKQRFNFLFKGFINVFTQENSPLVIFLDDLQWADAATIDLITFIMKDENIKYLFMICTYRNNEVNESHPLSSIFDQINNKEIKGSDILLSTLNKGHIAMLVFDTINCEKERADSLAEVIFSKTYGNPFFVNQFLKLLHEKNLIEFDFNNICWKWDIDKISHLNITNNVVDLLIEKIEELPQITQKILKICACLGNEFDLKLLSRVYGKSQIKTSLDILHAVKKGLIEAQSNFYVYISNYENSQEDAIFNDGKTITFKFAHDYIQLAIYTMMSGQLKKVINYSIGMILLNSIKNNQIDDKLFDIVKHLNRGRDLITEESKRIELARLNLATGKKAKASASYNYALRYFTIGMELLAGNSWEEQYQLTYDLYINRAECEYLNFQYDEAESLFKIILDHVRSDLEKAKVYKIKIILYINQDKAEEAVKIGLYALKILGMKIPSNPNNIQIASELLKVRFNSGIGKIEDILSLPFMEDTYKIAFMDILMSLTPVAYIINQKLFLLVVLKIINLSLKYGNSYASVFGYGVYGLIIGSVFGNYENGYKFGKLSLDLNEKINNIEVKSKCNYNFGWFINHWTVHARENILYLKRGFENGLEAGDLVFSAYCSASIIVTMYSKGDNLNDINREIKKYSNFMKQIKYEYINYIFIAIQRVVSRLQSSDNVNLNNGDFDEAEFEKKVIDCNIDAVKALYYLTNLQIAYLKEDYSKALEAIDNCQNYIVGAIGLLYSTDYYFYYSLTLTALYKSLTSTEKVKYLNILNRNQRKMKKWSQNCPENFLHKYLLVEAEIARIQGKDQRAIMLYNQAIKAAHKNEYMQNLGIASELAAKFHFSKDFDLIAKSYIEKAIDAYEVWGADIKAKAIRDKYSKVISRISIREKKEINDKGSFILTRNSTNSSYKLLDLNSIMKVSYTISKELVLENILESLMKIVIESSGAQRGLFFSEKESKFIVKSEGLIKGDIVEIHFPILYENEENIPRSIINYAKRTKKIVILDDATKDSNFAKDIYIKNISPKSILCIPIIHKGKVTEVLYLENNLISGVFTSERVEVLQILISQAAISIENASMYREIKEMNLNLEKKIERQNREILVKKEQLKSEIEKRQKLQEQKKQLLKELDDNNKLLEIMSKKDELTGLYNHKHIVECLVEMVNESKEHSKSLSIIKFDLDSFKDINERYGYHIGDDILVRIGLILRELLRNQDRIGRYGGEEFLVLLDDMKLSNAYHVAERIRKNIMNYTCIDGEVAVTISGGVIALTDETSEELIRRADRLLYKAKKNGGNRIETQ
ncbi:diguanylate cyclase [Wukongibacter sp. M2B1]|uniref:diguanylate cyclase n=1 Tax=Wukongibacter sp. M2B1 TaxID=3088895 RepID=UPI003D7A7CF3